MLGSSFMKIKRLARQVPSWPFFGVGMVKKKNICRLALSLFFVVALA